MLARLNRLHGAVIHLSRGRLGWRVGRMPVLELTTIGRRTGQPRTLLLTAAIVQGDGYVVVASKGGDDHHPAWFLNLRANPEVEVVVRDGPRQHMHARIATHEERARLWPQVERAYPGYRRYQRHTTREIPLVFLEPR